ncbi:hypothetical protein BS50DRAFT_332813 [Corynespora cassiicola Philippines]|uniref:Uncharacterized protein n=1 Tax=Corynespora cassiicola Philippines TaxID=1448308 RepID=A0A2T2NUP4_CORCC|nr:hypothetical protein BS50DRAFT_332813 [Corynespora cassiicola Philippines]
MQLPIFLNAPFLRTPEWAYQVLHDRADPFNPSGPITTTLMGTYSSLAVAESVAQDTLKNALNRYLRVGFHGQYHNDIDLVFRGKITAETTENASVTLSEFRIMPVAVWDATLGPISGGGETNELLVPTASEKRAVVRLPPAISTARQAAGGKAMNDTFSHREPCSAEANTSTLEASRPSNERIGFHRYPAKTHFKEESDIEWAQNRMIFPDRRNDWPFRGLLDAPYCETFHLGSWKPKVAPTLNTTEYDDGNTMVLTPSTTNYEEDETLYNSYELPEAYHSEGEGQDIEARERAFGTLEPLYYKTDLHHGNWLGGGRDIRRIYQGRRHSLGRHE